MGRRAVARNKKKWTKSRARQAGDEWAGGAGARALDEMTGGDSDATDRPWQRLGARRRGNSRRGFDASQYVTHIRGGLFPSPPGASHVPHHAADRRKAARRRPAQDTVGRLSGIADDQELARGLVWDISTTGVSLLLSERVEPGTLTRTELTSAGGATVCRVARVVRVSQLETGEYALGAQFVRALGEDELRPFVG